MKKLTKLSIVIITAVIAFIFIASNTADIDPKYIDKFGYGSICISQKEYPKIDKFDESLFDFRNGKFYLSKGNASLNARAILPEGKKYRDLVSDFTSRTPGWVDDNAEEQIVWRIFASHDKTGKKLFDTWPPAASDIPKEVTYATSEKELAFFHVRLFPNSDALDWSSSGVSTNDLIAWVGDWLNNAKPGWQLYFVHTVGYLEVHTGNDRYIVDDPILTATVEIK